MDMQDILCGISKVPFEIPYKKYSLYIGTYVLYSEVDV